MLDRPDIKTLINRIQSDFESRDPDSQVRLRRSVENVLSKVLAGAAHGIYGKLDWVSRQILPDKADIDQLKRLGAFYKVYQKEPGSAAAEYTFTGTDGSVIDAETLLQRSDGIEYITDEEATIADGEATVAITAVEGGTDGNADGGTSLTLVTPIDGVDPTATMSSAGATGGTDEEDIEDFRARLIERMGRQINGSNKHIYAIWAKEVSDVTRAWCLPQHMGRGTVGLTFVCDNQDGSFIPSDEKVEEVEAYIEAHTDATTGLPLGRCVTAELWVFAPSQKSINPQISVTPDTAAVRAAVEAELYDMLTRDAEPGGKIYVSRINEAISLAEGETNHVLESPTEDITTTAGEICVLGEIEWV
jgi:uncharacterized phage protein gp47/JayE